jgi:TonB-linked SusC/RagA family outer membrane protein
MQNKKGIVSAIPQITAHCWRNEQLFNLHYKFMKKNLTTLFYNWGREKTRQWLMRLAVLKMILLMSLLTSYARVNSQMIISNLKLQEVELSEALEKIEEQTDYDFVFSYDDVQGYKVSADLQLVTLEECLNTVLHELPFEYITEEDVVIVSYKEPVQVVEEEQQEKKTIKGTVYDKEGNSLPFANIIEKGTVNGTQSDSNGNYTLDVADENAILVVSYLGYNSAEVLIGNQLIIDIHLDESTSSLSEVIVTGVIKGTDSRKLPFSVGKVKEEDLKKVSGVNIANSLQGKIAGVSVSQTSGSPGSAPSIRLRGSANIIGSQAPLVIIDGVITDGDGALQDFSSDDVAHMEVIKGAAAASLYGSRSANGVINITTKRGGNKEGKPSITIRNEAGVSMLTGNISLSKHHPFLLNSEGKVNASKLSIDQFADNEYPILYNHQDRLFENGTFYTNFISIGTTSEKMKFYGSFNNTKQKGILVDTKGFRRQNIRVNIDYNISDKLNFKTSSFYSQSKKDGQFSGAGSAFSDALFIPPNFNLDDINEEDGSPYNYDIANTFMPGSVNPLYAINNIENESKRTRFTGSYSLSYKPFKSLTLEAAYTLDDSKDRQTRYVPKGYLSKEINPNNGELTNTFIESEYTTASIKATYSKSFKDFDFTSQLYYLYENVENNFTTVSGFNFRFNKVRSLSNSIGTPNLTKAGSSQEKIISENVYAIINLEYKNKLILDGMVRRDGSSLFGEDNRWNTFYRGSVAYRVSEDIKVEGINEFKLRASYGTAGNRPLFGYRFETFTSEGTKSTIGNKDLRSSLSKELELGLDVNFLNKYSFSATYAQSKSTEQFWLLNQSITAGGFPKQWVNLDASLDANIYEATLSGPIYNKNDLQITGSIIFSKVNQKLTRFNHVPTFSNNLYLEEGIDYGVMRGEKFATSIDQLSINQKQSGNYVINSDGFVVNTKDIGTINETPVKILDENGNPQLFNIANFNPDFNLGINFNMKYKGVSLYVLTDWKQGGDIYNQGKQMLYQVGRHGDVDQAAVSQNRKKPIGYYKALANNNTGTDFFVEDGTYVKIREIKLGYELSKKQLGKLAKIIDGIQVSLIGRNLFTFTKYSGYDPEVNSGSVQNNAFGQRSSDLTNYTVDAFGYPNSSTITGKVEIKF